MVWNDKVYNRHLKAKNVLLKNIVETLYKIIK